MRIDQIKLILSNVILFNNVLLDIYFLNLTVGLKFSKLFNTLLMCIKIIVV